MPVFGYDESHGERWTISDDLAFRRAPGNPERHAFGHLAWLSSETLNADSLRIRTAWNDAVLAAVDVLIVTEPDCVNGHDHSPELKRAESDALLEFIGGGGGLLVIAGATEDPEASAAVLAAELFGVRITGRKVLVPRDGSDYLLSDTAVCDEVGEHQTTREIQRIVCHRAVALEVGGEPLATIGTLVGDVVFVAMSYGAGRVAVVGSSELFAIPHIGQADNALLYIRILSWLAKVAEDRAGSASRADLVRRLVGEQVYPVRRSRHTPRPESATGGLVPTLHVSESEENLLELYDVGLDPYRETEDFLLRAEMAFHALPARIRRGMIEFRNNSNEFGALLVRGLPADPALPATPERPAARPIRQSYLSEFWLAVFSSALGDQIGYAQESGGTLFQNVLPTKENATRLSSESSQALLDFHTEVAFHPVMPDYLLLHCLRPDPEGKARTLISGTRSMIPLVPLRYRPVLFRQAFRTGVDYSFGSPNGLAGNGPLVSILDGDSFDPLMRLDPDLMVGIDQEADAALAAIKAAAYACEAQVALNACDLLVIDNRRSIHGRSPFKARYDGRDRWLQRSYVVRDANRYSAERERSRRVITTAFAV